MRRDLSDNLQVRASINPTRSVDNTALVGTAIDMQDFNSLMFAIAIGTVADADATFAFTLDESADNTTFTAVATADLVGTLAGAGFQFDSDNQIRKIGYIGAKRYIRPTITPANNTGNADISCVAILGHARLAPRTAQT